jgi:outer membrane receptor protein involved in Fe transport
VDNEPLPGILPLEARLGLRLEQPSDLPKWGLELSARLVARQDRVAASLLETPSPGFATGDLRGYWRAREGVFLAAGIENFTNTRYREHLDLRPQSEGIAVLQAGANFYVSGELNY